MCVSARNAKVKSPCQFSGKSLKQFVLSKRTLTSINLVVFEDGVTTFCISAALFQTEHPISCHLKQFCRISVSFLLSVSINWQTDASDFRKVCIWPALWNLLWRMFLYIGYWESKYRLRISLAHPLDCHFAHVQWLPLSIEKPQTPLREVRIMLMFVPVR